MRDVRVGALPDASTCPESTRSRLPVSVPLHRTVGAAVLAAVLVALTLLAGPHLVEHLVGADRDADHCVVCVALHGARAGIPAAPLTLLAAVVVVGRPTLEPLLAGPAVSPLSASSRAPPTLG